MDSTFSFCDFLRPKKQKLALTKIFFKNEIDTTSFRAIHIACEWVKGKV